MNDNPLIAERVVRSRPMSRLAREATRWGPWSTPTILRAARLLVAMLLLLTGVLGVVAAMARDAAIADIAGRIEPLSADTAVVYRSLADADAAVISEFVDGRVESGALRGRVENDLAAAAAGLARAAGRADDGATTDAIASLGTQLPTYSGLVELARANNRVGQPDGVPHLRRASELMQTSMLPVAESLLQDQARLLDDAYRRAGTVPIAPLVAAVVLSAVMIVLQVWMAGRFRRRQNLGMVIACGAVAVGGIWWTASTFGSGDHIATSQAHSEAIRGALVPAQIAALQARTTEGLGLVAGDSSARVQEFADREARLGPGGGTDGALGAATRLVTDPTARDRLQEAIRAAADYRDTHQQIVRAEAEGRHADAVRLALADDPDSAASAFGQLDTSLAAAVDAEHSSFAAETGRAAAWRLGLGPITAALTLIAICAAALGITARLEEYP